MTQRYSIADAMENLAKTFQTIDCRAALLKTQPAPEGADCSPAWISTFCVVRLAHAPVDEIRTRWGKRVAETGEVHTNHFRIVAEAQPITEWGNLANQLTEGILTMGGVPI